MSENDALLTYLKNDVSHLKIQNEILRRQSTRWATAVIALACAFIVCIFAFSGTVYLIVRECTEQVKTICSGDWSITEREDTAETILPSNMKGRATLNFNRVSDIGMVCGSTITGNQQGAK